MKVHPFDSYNGAEYPSIKDVSSGKKPVGNPKGAAALIMASLTVLSLSYCDPGAKKDNVQLAGAPTISETTITDLSIESTRTVGIVPEEWTEGTTGTSEETEEVILAGEVAYTETEAIFTEDIAEPGVVIPEN
ncbi:MAG: hypothetical protein GXY43_00530 [Clostridiaceae bacterium]|nr:hypothetical protein [Clostridiaceae bacterium]